MSKITFPFIQIFSPFPLLRQLGKVIFIMSDKIIILVLLTWANINAWNLNFVSKNISILFILSIMRRIGKNTDFSPFPLSEIPHNWPTQWANIHLENSVFSVLLGMTTGSENYQLQFAFDFLEKLYSFIFFLLLLICWKETSKDNMKLNHN